MQNVIMSLDEFLAMYPGVVQILKQEMRNNPKFIKHCSRVQYKGWTCLYGITAFKEDGNWMFMDSDVELEPLFEAPPESEQYDISY